MEFKGFNRVVVSKEGDATTPKMALDQGISADVGFLRKDGWSLGTPREFEDVAFSLWEQEWTHFILKGDTHWRPLRDYKTTI